MAKSLEKHCDELLRMAREERESEARINRACATLPVAEADRVARREMERQEALYREAQERIAEQLEKG